MFPFPALTGGHKDRERPTVGIEALRQGLVRPLYKRGDLAVGIDHTLVIHRVNRIGQLVEPRITLVDAPEPRRGAEPNLGMSDVCDKPWIRVDVLLEAEIQLRLVISVRTRQLDGTSSPLVIGLVANHVVLADF